MMVIFFLYTSLYTPFDIQLTLNIPNLATLTQLASSENQSILPHITEHIWLFFHISHSGDNPTLNSIYCSIPHVKCSREASSSSS